VWPARRSSGGKSNSSSLISPSSLYRTGRKRPGGGGRGGDIGENAAMTHTGVSTLRDITHATHGNARNQAEQRRHHDHIGNSEGTFTYIAWVTLCRSG
jgi:hypothetical protein